MNNLKGTISPGLFTSRGARLGLVVQIQGSAGEAVDNKLFIIIIGIFYE